MKGGRRLGGIEGRGYRRKEVQKEGWMEMDKK